MPSAHIGVVRGPKSSRGIHAAKLAYNSPSLAPDSQHT